MLKVYNPHAFRFEGIPARTEGEVPYDAAKARRFGLEPVAVESAKGKPGPKPKAANDNAEGADGAKG